ncbi:MAG: hypothetical protein R3A12_11625 [Ignavibacteria bacterium]
MKINTGIILGSGLGKLTEELNYPNSYMKIIQVSKIKISKGKFCGKRYWLFSEERQFL